MIEKSRDSNHMNDLCDICSARKIRYGSEYNNRCDFFAIIKNFVDAKSSPLVSGDRFFLIDLGTKVCYQKQCKLKLSLRKTLV